RLDDDRNALAREPLGGILQIRNIGALRRNTVVSPRQYSSHGMDETAVRRLGVDQRLFQAVPKFLLAPGQSCDAALTPRPVAGRHVEQCLDEPVPVQLLRNYLGRILVRREILDRLEAAGSGSGEPIEKPDLLEDEAEIGGEFRHGSILVCGANGGEL